MEHCEKKKGSNASGTSLTKGNNDKGVLLIEKGIIYLSMANGKGEQCYQDHY